MKKLLTLLVFLAFIVGYGWADSVPTSLMVGSYEEETVITVDTETALGDSGGDAGCVWNSPRFLLGVAFLVIALLLLLVPIPATCRLRFNEGISEDAAFWLGTIGSVFLIVSMVLTFSAV